MEQSIIIQPEKALYENALLCYDSLNFYFQKKGENGIINDQYYETLINNFIDQSVQNLDQYENIKNNKEILINFINDLGELSKKTIETFLLLETCNVFETPLQPNYNQRNALKWNKFHKSKERVIFLLDIIESYERNISYLIEHYSIETAIFTQKRFVKLFKDNTDLLIKSKFGIDVYRSPLKVKFENVIESFKGISNN